MNFRRVLLILSFLVLRVPFSSAQNLVPNGNFDTLIVCPSGISQIGYAPNWNSLSNHLGSPDYFHTCAPGSAAIHVPNNVFGSEVPYSGSAYGGEVVWSTSGGGQAREYMMTPLLDTIETGKFYKVSLHYSVGEISKYFIAGLGIYFSDSIPQGNNTYNPLNVTPQLVCTDTLTTFNGWSKISFIYHASGNARYMTIGNFNDNANTPVIPANNTTSNMSYMYFDDVSVEYFCVVTNEPVICPGDSTYLHASLVEPGSIYGWATKNNPSVLLTTDTGLWVKPATTTTYLVFSSCDTQEVVVKVNAVPVVDLGKDTTICKGRSIQLKAPPTQASYLWHNNTTQSTCTINDTGTYWVWVSNGLCVDADTIHIGLDTPKFTVNLGPDTTICVGTAFSISTGLQSPYYHLWSTGTSVINSIPVNTSGTYSVIVYDGSCYNYDTIIVTIDTPRFKVDLGPDTFICAGSTKLLDAGFAGSVYKWQDSSTIQVFSVTQTGVYIVEVKRNGFACKITDSVTIIQLLLPQLDIGPDTFICPGKHITLDVKNVFYDSILWSNNTTLTTLTTSDSGVYSVRVYDGSCYNHDTVKISTYPKVNFSIGNDTVICQGTPFDLNTGLNSPYTFLWNNNLNTPSIQISQTGTYWVRVFDGYCYQYDTSQVRIDTVMFTVNLGEDQILCEGDTIWLDAKLNDATYTWNNLSTNKVIPVMQNGIYSVSVKRTGYTCPVSDSIRVLFFQYPSVSLGQDQVLCKDSILVFDLRNQGYERIQWQDNNRDSVYTISTNGTYVVTVSSNNCSTSDTVVVVSPQPKDLGLSSTYSACVNTPLNVDLSNKLNKLIWENGDTNLFRTIMNPGNYSLIYTNQGCVFKESFERQNIYKPIFDLPQDTIVCELDKLVLDPKAANGNIFLWQDGSTGSTYQPQKFGVYSVTITNTCGSKTDSIEVVDCECDLLMPTAFSPTNDNLNETFKPVGCAPHFYHLIIYNRWGQQIYETFDFNAGWDGTFKGEAVADNTYVWVVKFAKNKRSGMANKLLKGTVLLMR